MKLKLSNESLRAAALLAAALLALSAAGCGSSNPTAPTPTPMPPLSAVTLTPVTDTLQVGQFVRFTATALDTLGAMVGDASFSWTSSNPNVFTVDGTGQVHAHSEGFGQLTASAGGKADTSTVAVFVQRGWYLQVTNFANDLNGVFFLPDRRTGWAVGNGGRIFATTDAGQTWTSEVSFTAFNLNAVWFTSASDGWAVGTGGTILHNDGKGWASVTSNASENLMDVQFASRDTGWAVGSGGVILRTFNHGGNWARLNPTLNTLRSVSFAGTRDGWVVGDGGVIFGTHDRGLSWYPVLPAVTGFSLNAVWRRSTNLAWAAGVNGSALYYVSTPDTSWVLNNPGSTFTLQGVCYPSDQIGYAVGFDSANTGLILRTDDGGLSWQNQPSNTQFRLKDVFFTDPLNGWAVGRNGVVMHTSTGGLP